MLLQQRLDGVAAVQQMAAIDAQFLGQVLGRRTLGDATQDEDQRRAPLVARGPPGGGEQVEDGAAGPAAVVQDGGPMPVMRCLPKGQRMAGRADQTSGMEHLEQDVMAALFIEHVANRKEQHGGLLSLARHHRVRLPCSSQPPSSTPVHP